MCHVNEIFMQSTLAVQLLSTQKYENYKRKLYTEHY